MILLLVAGPGFSQTRSDDAPADWLQLVPADARLYVEFRDLRTTQLRLERLGILDALSRLGDRADVSAASQPLRPRSNVFLGMRPEEAVSMILGRRSALIARDPRRWKQGVVLAELHDDKTADLLVRNWNPRRRPPVGPVQCYQLGKAGPLLARRGRMLLFGPAGDPDGLVDRAIRLLADPGRDCIANRPDIANLRGRLAAAPEVLVLVAPSEVAAASRAAVGDRRESILLAAFQFHRGLLQIEIQRSIAAVDATAARADRPILVAPPPDTVLLWNGVLDGAAWRRELDAASAGSVWGTLLQMSRELLGDRGVGSDAFDRIGPNTAFIVQRAAARPDTGYQAPALSLLLDARESPRVAEDFGKLASMLARYVNTQLARTHSAASPIQIETRDVHGHSLQVLRIGGALDLFTDCPFLERVELAWIQTDSRFVLSTDASAAESLALFGGSVPAATRPLHAAPLQSPVLRIDGQALAAMLQSWLDFTARTAPDALRRPWWVERARRRAREAERFGVTLRGRPAASQATQPAEPPGALVEAVEPGSPAASVLRPGDLIERIDGRPLTSDHPAREAAECFRARLRDSAVIVTFRRNGRQLTRDILLRDAFDESSVFFPLRIIRPLVALSRAIDEVDVVAAADGQELHVAIHWHAKH